MPETLNVYNAQSKFGDSFKDFKASWMERETIVIILIQVMSESEPHLTKDITNTYAIKAVGNVYTIDPMSD